ncbi:BnaAnng17550D [Brassica napus]|uniref:BnaAnng17550D protein n=2 Tax=Brassica TaxID=3705 RepID=A0A078J964_BRANA|nr:BnaAnng17550D [Brassica napus]
MASMSMTATFVPAVAKETQNSTTMRRDLMFTAAAAAVFSLAKAAMADEEEPKRGTDAAKKKYAQVCVTMPTAKICRY